MLLDIVHYLHILSGVTWAGGTFLMMVGVYPVLARMPAGAAQDVFKRLARRASMVLGAAGGLTLLLGLGRAAAGGGIRSFSDLGSGYGMAVIAAIVVWVLVGATEVRFRRRFEALLGDEAGFSALAPAMVNRGALIVSALFALLIAVMAVLGLGLY